MFFQAPELGFFANYSLPNECAPGSLGLGIFPVLALQFEQVHSPPLKPKSEGVVGQKLCRFRFDAFDGFQKETPRVDALDVGSLRQDSASFREIARRRRQKIGFVPSATIDCPSDWRKVVMSHGADVLHGLAKSARKGIHLI